MPIHEPVSPRRGDLGNTNTKSSYMGRMVLKAREKLKSLSVQQAELSEHREQVLVDRQTFIESGKRVHQQRCKTANAEVSLMNIFRGLYNGLGLPLPPEMDIAYTVLEKERNHLGVLETEHTQTEDNLGALEWNFMELENDLYQYDLQQILADEAFEDTDSPIESPQPMDLRSPDPVPVSNSVQYFVAFKEYKRLMGDYQSLRQSIAKRLSEVDMDEDEALDLGSDNTLDSSSELLIEIAEREVRLRALKAALGSSPEYSSSPGRYPSEPAPQNRALSVTSYPVSQTRSYDGALEKTERPPTAPHVTEWLLDLWKQNALEKVQYLRILRRALGFKSEEFGLPNWNWEDLATQQWPLDIMELPELPHVAVHLSTRDTSRKASLEETQLRFVDMNGMGSFGNAYSNATSGLELLDDLAIGRSAHVPYHAEYNLELKKAANSELSTHIDENSVRFQSQTPQVEQTPASSYHTIRHIEINDPCVVLPQPIDTRDTPNDNFISPKTEQGLEIAQNQLEAPHCAHSRLSGRDRPTVLSLQLPGINAYSIFESMHMPPLLTILEYSFFQSIDNVVHSNCPVEPHMGHLFASAQIKANSFSAEKSSAYLGISRWNYYP